MIELKYNQKNLQNFQCFIDRKQNNIYKSKFIFTNIPSPSTFSHKKMYHPIRYNKPIPTTLMSVHTTQRNQQYSTIFNIQHFSAYNIIQHITFPISFYMNNFSNSSASNILDEGRSLIVLEKLMGCFHVFRQKLIKTPALGSVFIFTKKNFPKCFLFSADNQLGW